MKLLTLAKEISGTVRGPDRELGSIVTDSRKVREGDCFIALKGEKYDGHDFISQAITNGAKVILLQQENPVTRYVDDDVSFLRVQDTTIALGAFAAFWRRLVSMPVIGITGSCGKTTVKGMLGAICQQQGKTLVTQGNFNNHIGLPLTLLQLDATYQFAVIEMGANHPGEIHYLGKIAQPTISVITTVQPAHLEGFGSVENVAKAKGEIYDVLPEHGTAVLNIESQYSPLWRKIIKNRMIITYGLQETATVHASEINLGSDKVSFILHLREKKQRVTLNIPGKHTVMNALSAAACADALNISLENMIKGLENFQGVPGRLCQLTGLHGARIIDDTYNANPGSMQAALEVLAHCQGHKMFVMGDMGELGQDAALYHTEIGEYAKKIGIDSLYAVGKLSEFAVKAFGKQGKIYASQEALVTDLKLQLNSKTVVLVKGSRSARMENITNALKIQVEC